MSEALERRAVKCKHWQWLPGMRWRGTLSQNTGRLGEVFQTVPGPVGVYLPDLTDAATLGCLLALVREAYDDGDAYVGRYAGYCSFETLDPMAPRVTAPTEAHCLVAALEAAP